MNRSVRIFASVALLGGLLVGLIPSDVSAAAAPTKVMVVGDSISQGHQGDYTWRYRLWQQLKTSNASVDFVGPKQGVKDDVNDVDTMDYVDPNFDNDHDATWGRPLILEKDTIASEVAASNPDVVLVNLGTNDLAWWGLTGQQTADQLTAFIQNARSANPNLKFIISEITPRSNVDADYTTRWNDYNNLIPTVATSLTTATSPIYTADPRPGFNSAVDTYDGTHPSALGEYKIAAAFASSLATKLSIGAAFTTIPTSVAWPIAPLNVVATPGNTVANLSWNPVVGAGGYCVFQRNVTAGETTPTMLPWCIATTSMQPGYLANGSTYEFSVATIRGNIIGPRSNVVSVIPGSLVAPASLTATRGDASVTLNWSAVSGASGYGIWQRDVTAGATTLTRKSGNVTTTSSTITGLTNGHTYEFAVTTMNSTLEGLKSAAVQATPTLASLPAPSGGKAVAGANSVALSWTPVAGAVGYTLWQRDSTAGQTAFQRQPQVIAGTAGSLTVSSLIAGHKYDFRLSTISWSKEGSPSAVVSATPTGTLPATPTGLTGKAGNAEVQLSWTAVSGATSYVVTQKDTTAGTAAVRLSADATSGNGLIISGLTNAHNYTFTVAAINASGESSASAAVTVKPTTSSVL